MEKNEVYENIKNVILELQDEIKKNKWKIKIKKVKLMSINK